MSAWCVGCVWVVLSIKHCCKHSVGSPGSDGGMQGCEHNTTKAVTVTVLIVFLTDICMACCAVLPYRAQGLVWPEPRHAVDT